MSAWIAWLASAGHRIKARTSHMHVMRKARAQQDQLPAVCLCGCTQRGPVNPLRMRPLRAKSCGRREGNSAARKPEAQVAENHSKTPPSTPHLLCEHQPSRDFALGEHRGALSRGLGMSGTQGEYLDPGEDNTPTRTPWHFPHTHHESQPGAHIGIGVPPRTARPWLALPPRTDPWSEPVHLLPSVRNHRRTSLRQEGAKSSVL